MKCDLDQIEAVGFEYKLTFNVGDKKGDEEKGKIDGTSRKIRERERTSEREKE